MYSKYAKSLAEIIRPFLAIYHLFADDTQLGKAVNLNVPGDLQSSTATLESCISRISDWIASNKLKLNEEKTEYIIFGSKLNIKKLGDQSISVGGNNINSVQVVRNLGLRMDSTLNFHDILCLSRR